MDYQNIVAFHGHECPGLAMGYRMATAAMTALQALRPEDEEIVAIVENDACGVDALQCVTGCTFGKGNLIFHDYGKSVYTLYSRKDGKGVRVRFHGDGLPKGVRDDRQAYMKAILSAPDSDIVTVQEVEITEPPKAVIGKSVTCSSCGENVMETRTRQVNGQAVCIPCAEQGLG